MKLKNILFQACGLGDVYKRQGFQAMPDMVWE